MYRIKFALEYSYLGNNLLFSYIKIAFLKLNLKQGCLK